MRGVMLFNSRLACSMVGVLSELLGETLIYLVDQKHEKFAHWLSLLKNVFIILISKHFETIIRRSFTEPIIKAMEILNKV